MPAPPRHCIERVCFNFGGTCNMKCDYCYIPFTGTKVDSSRCLAIVDRCAELGAAVITIGGGDPMAFRAIESMIVRCRDHNVEVHIDTNAISLRPRHIPLLRDSVSLVSMPLDGSASAVHDEMRSYPGHFDIVLNRITSLPHGTPRLKINTVVSRKNRADMVNMVDLISRLSPFRWSLYQYWPLSLGSRSARFHQLDEFEFTEVANSLPPAIGDCDVEINPIAERAGTYLFVSHDGEVYTHHASDNNSYVMLGSIFSDETIESWRSLSIPSVRARAIGRYDSIGRSS